MSYTTLYLVPEEGEVESYAEFKNAFQGSFNVWSEMGKSYLGMENVSFVNMKPVWNLFKDGKVLLNDRIVLASTFDWIMVKREHLSVVVDAMDDFSKRYESGHLPEQAEKLRELAHDESCYAACWCQTSVVGDMWERVDAEEEETYRMYDISRDTDHWFLFDDMPLPEERRNDL